MTKAFCKLQGFVFTILSLSTTQASAAWGCSCLNFFFFTYLQEERKEKKEKSKYRSSLEIQGEKRKVIIKAEDDGREWPSSLLPHQEYAPFCTLICLSHESVSNTCQQLLQWWLYILMSNKQVLTNTIVQKYSVKMVLYTIWFYPEFPVEQSLQQSALDVNNFYIFEFSRENLIKVGWCDSNTEPTANKRCQ